MHKLLCLFICQSQPDKELLIEGIILILKTIFGARLEITFKTVFAGVEGLEPSARGLGEKESNIRKSSSYEGKHISALVFADEMPTNISSKGDGDAYR